jgi:hypothetical protein
MSMELFVILAAGSVIMSSEDLLDAAKECQSMAADEAE